jgi:hypothetical protein
MKASFVELAPFMRVRDHYFDDDSFKDLQFELMTKPDAGNLIRGTGGLRKFRFTDERRGKGKRSGLRVIYFWSDPRKEFWLFTVYDKDEMTDLTAGQRKTLKDYLESEISRSKER